MFVLKQGNQEMGVFVSVLICLLDSHILFILGLLTPGQEGPTFAGFRALADVQTSPVCCNLSALSSQKVHGVFVNCREGWP